MWRNFRSGGQMVRGFLDLPRPLLSDEVVKPPIVSKTTVQRCISKLSPHWDHEQLEAVVSMFKAHGLL